MKMNAPHMGIALTIEVGDSVKEGDVLCIIEAMKLFNEIEMSFFCKARWAKT